MIDTHCPLTFRDFAGRVEEVPFAAKVAGVRGVITVGTTPGDLSAGPPIDHCAAGIARLARVGWGSTPEDIGGLAAYGNRKNLANAFADDMPL